MKNYAYTQVEFEQWYSYFYCGTSSEVASSVARCPELHEKPDSKSQVWGYFGMEKKKERRASEGDCYLLFLLWESGYFAQVATYSPICALRMVIWIST